ncbi:MAG: MerR family transcriptional regulator [Alphaproteobacteria bacterium]
MRRKTIGVLSKECGVKVTTIRYYESIGLIREPDRTGSGQRIYDALAVERLNFIRHARDLGFPIDAIRELIDLQESPSMGCASVDRIARSQLADVRRRLNQLEALEAELKNMITMCKGGEIANCKVLQTLSNHDECLDVHGAHEEFKPIIS